MSGDFGVLLRRLRIAANLSQEALAEKSQVSPGAISAYERGLRSAPHRESVVRLAAALGVAGPAFEEFAATARRKPRAKASSPNTENGATSFGNLPPETTSFVGRESETEEIAELLRRHRVVTITGSGGIGKTRVALQVASRFQPTPRDGSWIVDLTSVNDSALLRAKVSAILAVPVRKATAAKQPESRQMLLVLDSCEHIIEPVVELVTEMVTAYPKVTFLATSRERLRITSEAVFRLASLAVPARHPKSVAEASRYAAIELFVERARRCDHHFILSDRRVALVADLCRKLDGLPLAIELAAARLPSLGLTGLSKKLADSFSTLSLGARDVPARQRTLTAAIDWSYSLLENHERLLLQRLSVFHGGSTLDAIEAVCPDAQLPAEFIADSLSSLVEKSLVVVDGREDTVRYALLQTTLSYARTKLVDDRTPLYRRHAAWCAKFAETMEAHVFDMSTRDWVTLASPELENIDRAVQWATGTDGDHALAARIVGCLPLWAHLKRLVREEVGWT